MIITRPTLYKTKPYHKNIDYVANGAVRMSNVEGRMLDDCFNRGEAELNIHPLALDI